jgi:type 1 glutamine amidotransferase
MYSKQVLLLLLSFSLLFTYESSSQTKHILVFSKTAGYRHASIEAGVQAIKDLGALHAFKVTATEDATIFNSDSLKKYDAVVFLSTTMDILNTKQEHSFKAFINGGGGFVGIHAAADTEYDWPWYGKLVGAYFESHPEGVDQATIRALDTTHQAMKNVPKEWSRTDEWYNYKNISSELTILANLDESTYEGGKNGKNHPIAWAQEFEGGKMFYTGLGHTSESFKEPFFLVHILGGIQYVLAD